jgi:tRNA (mo5U34)-methyltransferase
MRILAFHGRKWLEPYYHENELVFSKACLGGAMTRGEILSEIERLKPWFHCIELLPGIRTKNESVADEPLDHPLSTWRTIRQCLPDDLTGRSLLDVGCNGGFYAVEAKRLNASRVLGIDSQRHHIQQALFVRKVLGLDIEFQRMSVYDLSPRSVGQFDITLALGLIYHCKHLVLALEKLFHVTKDTLIIETAVLPPKQFPASFVQTFGGLPSTLHPLAYVENPYGAKEAAYNWFLPSPEGAQAILRNIGFDDVSLFEATEHRAVLICRKQDTAANSQPLSYLASKLEMEHGDTTCKPGSEIRFRVRIENVGSTKWSTLGNPATKEGAIQLGIHLVRGDEAVAIWEYGRVSLKSDLAPGEYELLEVNLRAPDQPGKYFVEFDMVAEHLSWFEDLGSAILRQEINVA